MFGLGFSELILIAIIALIFIGPKQLPEVAKTLARFLNELKRASDDLTKSIQIPPPNSPSEPSQQSPSSQKEIAAEQPHSGLTQETSVRDTVITENTESKIPFHQDASFTLSPLKSSNNPLVAKNDDQTKKDKSPDNSTLDNKTEGQKNEH